MAMKYQDALKVWAIDQLKKNNAAFSGTVKPETVDVDFEFYYDDTFINVCATTDKGYFEHQIDVSDFKFETFIGEIVEAGNGTIYGNIRGNAT